MSERLEEALRRARRIVARVRALWRTARPRARWGAVAAAALLLGGLLLAIWPEPARRVVEAALEPGSMARVEGHAAALRAAAAEEGLDPNLLAAICYVESRGKVGAVSSADALGLMQLTLASAADAARALGLAPPTREELLTDAGLNVRLGARHFAWTLEHEERDVERALCAYNAGRGRLGGWIRAAGSYRAWRSKQLRDGDSQVLAYALKVLDMAEAFRERGVLDGRPAAEQVAEDERTVVR